MEKKELKERFFDRFFYAEDGSGDWDRWRKQDPSVVLEFILEELEKAREEMADEVAREIGYGKLSGEEHYKTLNRVIKLISKLKDNK